MRGDLSMTYRAARSFWRSLAPPLLQAAVFRFRYRKRLRRPYETWVGVYGSFDEVRRAFPDAVAYHSRESEQDDIAEMRAAKAAFDRARRGDAPPAHDHYGLLCLLAYATGSKGIAILDFGGAAGWAAAHLAFCCPDQDATLFVTELPAVCDAGRAIFAEVPRVRYVSGWDAIDRPLDIAFFGSSLQYVEDWRALLRQVTALAPRIIAIIDSPMSDLPTFACAQVNMVPRVITSLVFDRAALIGHLRTLGFRLVHQERQPKVEHFDNYPAPYNSADHWNLIFERSAPGAASANV